MSDTTSRCYINEIPKAQKCWDEYRCRTPVLCMHGAVCHLQNVPYSAPRQIRVDVQT